MMLLQHVFMSQQSKGLQAQVVQGLCNLGLHPAYAHLEKDYPVGDQSLMRRLARTLSALTHWAPVLGEVAFLPALAFPFVRLFKADLESCFEVWLSRPAAVSKCAIGSPTSRPWSFLHALPTAHSFGPGCKHDED